MGEPGKYTGIKVTFIISIDIAGSIPDMVKTKISGEAQYETMDKTIKYIKKNYPKK